jgi:hypothetical protein
MSKFVFRSGVSAERRKSLSNGSDRITDRWGETLDVVTASLTNVLTASLTLRKVWRHGGERSEPE